MTDAERDQFAPGYIESIPVLALRIEQLRAEVAALRKICEGIAARLEKLEDTVRLEVQWKE